MFSFIPYLKAIISYQNLSIAAEKLSISQPALSTALKKTEEQLGGLIFDRTQKPWKLTEIGHWYYQYGIDYYNHVDELKNRVIDVGELKCGKLRIGGSNLFNTTYLTKALSVFMEKYPGIELTLVDGTVPELLNKIQLGDIDLFLTPNFVESPNITYEKIFSEKILLCVPRNYSINSELEKYQIKKETIIQGDSASLTEIIEPVSLKLFETYPFILLQESQQIGKMLRKMMKEEAVYPEKVIWANQMTTSLALTNAGMGISLISETAIRYGNFKEAPIFYMSNMDICKREMSVGYYTQRYLSNAAKEFIQIIKYIYYNN